jgi:hypothetical protein
MEAEDSARRVLGVVRGCSEAMEDSEAGDSEAMEDSEAGDSELAEDSEVGDSEVAEVFARHPLWF